MSEMKYSGVNWIGDVPASWEAKAIRHLISEHFSGSWGNDAKENEKDRICMRIADFDFEKMQFKIFDREQYTVRNYSDVEIYKKTLRYGDLLIEKSGGGEKTPVGRTVVYRLPYEALFANFMDCIRLNSALDVEFAKYAFFSLYKSGETNLYFNQTTGLQNMNMSKFLRECKLPVAPIDDQKAIALFLDSKCAELDAFHSDIEQQIKTLEDYRKSIIIETVTQGLKIDIEMKDSGIQWIGKIPVGWKCIRGKYILKYIQKPVREDDGVVTCFRDGEVTLRSNRREDGFTMADKEIGYQGIDVGDLVVHGMDGFAGAIGISDSRGKASPVLNVLDTEQNKRYIMYFLRSMAYNDVFLALATGIRVRSCDLRWNKLSELFYPVPPIDEQEAIVAHIDSVIEKTNAIIADKKAQLETIDAYKKSLIFEYVTGKKEVPVNG